MTRANIKRIKRGEPPIYKDAGPQICKSIPKFCKLSKDNKYYNLRNGLQTSPDIIMKFKRIYKMAVKKLLIAGNRDFTYYSYDILDEILSDWLEEY